MTAPRTLRCIHCGAIYATDKPGYVIRADAKAVCWDARACAERVNRRTAQQGKDVP